MSIDEQQKAGATRKRVSEISSAKRAMKLPRSPGRRARKRLVTTSMIVVLALITGVFFLGIDSALGFVIGRILGMKS